MWIVIDTNIFFKDIRLTKSLDLLFKEIENLHFTLKIPEVVVQETIDKYLEARQKGLNQIGSGTRKLKNNTSLRFEEISFQEDELNRDLSIYESYLRRKISSNGNIIPYPQVTHESLVKRAIEGKKPFNNNGEGFRDVLIWENILELASNQNCPNICLISDNTKDFSEDSHLHSELKADLVNIGLPENKVILYTSLDNFIDEIVDPILIELNDIQEQIGDDDFPNLNLQNVADEYIWNLVEGFGIDPNCLPDFSWYDGEPTISSGTKEPISNPEDTIVKRFSQNELLITAFYELDCDINFYLPKSDIYSESFIKTGFYINVNDWSDHIAQCGIELTLIIGLRFIFNEKTLEINSVDIVSANCP